MYKKFSLVSEGLADTLLDQQTILKMRGLDPGSIKNEPELLFLGTSAMKPTNYRGASAIYYFNEDKSAGLLMDSAEGSYG